MGNKKFNLTKLALAMGVTLSLSGCFSDNDNNIEVKPPVDTVDVGEIPDGTATEKQAGFFTIAVKNVAGENLGTSEAPVTVRITKNGDNVVSPKGEALTSTELTLNNGLGLFTASISEVTEEGTNITVNFSADGYFNNSTVVTLSSEITEAASTVILTPRAEVEGVAIAAEEVELGETVTMAEDGTLTSDEPITLTQEVTKEDATEEDDKGGATITIPSGSKMLTKNEAGELVPLTSKPKLAVAYFNNEASTTAAANADDATAEEQTRDTSSLDFFPGGLDLAVSVPAADTDNAEETAQNGSFTTAGFVAIELTDEDGNKVKEFGDSGEVDEDGNPIKNSIEVKMQVDVKTANTCPMSYTPVLADDLTDDEIAALLKQKDVEGFATDSAKQTDGAYFRKGACISPDGTAIESRTIKAGDIVPVWSYDADVAEWSFESYGVAQVNESNADVFDVVVNVTHLSYWNLDFFNWRQANNGNCGTSNNVRFDIVYADGTTDNVSAFDLLVESQSGGYRKLKRGYESTFFNESRIYYPPAFSVFMQLLQNKANIVDGVLNTDNSTDKVFTDNPVDEQASRLKLDDLCELNGKTVVLTIDAPEPPVDQPVKTQFVCSNTDDFDVAPAPVPTSTFVYLYNSDNVYQGRRYTNNDGTTTFTNVVAGNYTVRALDPNTNALVDSAEFAASTTEQVVNLPVECEVNTVPVTGTGGS
ncbi:hypothetical protein [Pseudoalteromonas sp. MTN2-4]|uniref:hypothetical protein n=1 Tax=Pseudoalteromonas sp. MTN2-4 TaxID=3056555 RepID=UPI0036F3F372